MVSVLWTMHTLLNGIFNLTPWHLNCFKTIKCLIFVAALCIECFVIMIPRLSCQRSTFLSDGSAWGLCMRDLHLWLLLTIVRAEPDHLKQSLWLKNQFCYATIEKFSVHCDLLHKINKVLRCNIIFFWCRQPKTLVVLKWKGFFLNVQSLIGKFSTLQSYPAQLPFMNGILLRKK